MSKNVDTDRLLNGQVNERSSNDKSSRKGLFIGGLAGSICVVVILGLFLSIPLTAVVIGSEYRDPRCCPIEPRLSLFLIVHGSVTIGSTVFLILLTIYFVSRGSSMSILVGRIFFVILLIEIVFSLIWLIVGSVWTFRVANRVIHEYDRMNHYYLFTYCHPVLYKFTFAYIILSYVVLLFQCCFSRCTGLFHSNK